MHLGNYAQTLAPEEIRYLHVYVYEILELERILGWELSVWLDFDIL